MWLSMLGSGRHYITFEFLVVWKPVPDHSENQTSPHDFHLTTDFAEAESYPRRCCHLAVYEIQLEKSSGGTMHFYLMAPYQGSWLQVSHKTSELT